MKTNTSRNLMTSTPSIFIGWPPHSSHHLVVVSMSRTIVCHAPIDTPASLGGNNWAHKDPAGNDTIISVTNKNSFFMGSSFIECEDRLTSRPVLDRLAPLRADSWPWYLP